MAVEDQVIAITGASGGIGASTARLLAARGARVVLGARREDALERVVADIEAGGGHAAARAVDVTRPEDLKRLVGLAVERFGHLDALVANAGVAAVAPLAQGTLADWNQMLDVNLRGVLHGIAAALPVFSAQGPVISSPSHRPQPLSGCRGNTPPVRRGYERSARCCARRSGRRFAPP